MLRRIFARKSVRPGADADARVDRQAVERLIKLRLNNLQLYERALTHRSLLRSEPGAGLHSNERLEYLGDAVLGLIVAEHLFRKFSDRDEGFMTRLRAKLVNGRALAKSASRINLGAYLLVSDSLAESNGRSSQSVLADAFEALIGAIYLDLGIDAARRFVTRTVLKRVNLSELARRKDNHKSALLEYAQARQWPQPTYRVVAEAGPSHNRTFSIEVLVNGRQLGEGRAKSKKKAEQSAAAAALEQLSEDETHTG